MSRGRLQAPRAQRGLPLTLSRQDYIAWPCQEKKNAAATGSRPCGCQGRGVSRTSRQQSSQECWQSSREDWPAGAAAHSPAVKDQSNDTPLRPGRGLGAPSPQRERLPTPAPPGTSVPRLHVPCLLQISTNGQDHTPPRRRRDHAADHQDAGKPLWGRIQHRAELARSERNGRAVTPARAQAPVGSGSPQAYGGGPPRGSAVPSVVELKDPV
jgi:hypothetical protein